MQKAKFRSLTGECDHPFDRRSRDNILKVQPGIAHVYISAICCKFMQRNTDMASACVAPKRKGVLKHIHAPSEGDRVLDRTVGSRMLVPALLNEKQATW